MSDVFDTCESNFLKNIRFVQKTLQESKDANKLDDMNEALSDATQEVFLIPCIDQQNGNRKRYLPKGWDESQGKCHSIEITLYKDELRTYKRRLN